MISTFQIWMTTKYHALVKKKKKQNKKLGIMLLLKKKKKNRCHALVKKKKKKKKTKYHSWRPQNIDYWSMITLSWVSNNPYVKSRVFGSG